MDLKSSQKFRYLLKGETTERHFLLLSSEVELIKKYLRNFPEKGLVDAFQWFTGKPVENIKEVYLEQVFYQFISEEPQSLQVL